MIYIYNKTNGSTYRAFLRWWNEKEFCLDPDILEDVDTGLAKKWDPTIGMFVMCQEELDDWEVFWRAEIEDAKIGLSCLLVEGDYVFICE